MPFYRNRRPAPKRPAAEIAAEKAAHRARQMTCQICGRPIFAETGVIAHHGYERPGTGWQTASCEGARRLPFEVTASELQSHLIAVQAKIERIAEVLAKVESEQEPLTWTYTDKTRPPQHRPFARHGTTTVRGVTRETFPAFFATYAENRPHRVAPEVTFDDLKQSKVRELTSTIDELKDYFTSQRARLSSHKQTHARNPDLESPQTWVTIS